MKLTRRTMTLGMLALGVFAQSAARPPARLGDPVELDIVKLTSIEWKQGDTLPKWVRELDGKEVVISGFINQRFRDDTDELLIVSDSCQCAGTPLPQHFVEVSLDKKTGYKGGELTFIGTFSAGEVEEDGFVASLFRLDGKFF